MRPGAAKTQVATIQSCELLKSFITMVISERTGGVMLPDGFEVVVIHKKDKACKSEPPRLYWSASPYSVLQLTHRWEPRCLVITAQA